MAVAYEVGLITKAFSGKFGVDDNAMTSILGKWPAQQRKSFRKATSIVFNEVTTGTEDCRQFERWDDRNIQQLRHEFLRFKNATVLWIMHPWERDARFVKEALTKNSQTYNVLIEVGCTRSSEDLLGARRAYHALFENSIEEEVAVKIKGIERKLFVALLSSYRYEGPRVNEETAKVEAKLINQAIKNGGKKNPIEDEEVVRILTTRSKPHIKAICKYYKELYSKNLDEDLDKGSSLKETVQCLDTPEKYFGKVLDAALETKADEYAKEALTRVIVTRAEVDMKKIKEEYKNKYGIDLSKMIGDITNGNYKDFLLTLVAKGE